MPSLKAQLTSLAAAAFAATGYDPQYSEVTLSNRPDLAQFQCNGALAAAKAYNSPPRQISQSVSEQLQASGCFQTVAVAGPGFINLTLTDDFLADHLRTLAADDRLGCPLTLQPLRIVVDYGGYLLYTAVRARSILNRAAVEQLAIGPILPPASASERELMLKLVELPEVIDLATF